MMGIFRFKQQRCRVYHYGYDGRMQGKPQHDSRCTKKKVSPHTPL
nr:MAG TPA: hypothetical protein [Caudoviricetes sp.]